MPVLRAARPDRDWLAKSVAPRCAYAGVPALPPVPWVIELAA